MINACNNHTNTNTKPMSCQSSGDSDCDCRLVNDLKNVAHLRMQTCRTILQTLRLPTHSRWNAGASHCMMGKKSSTACWISFGNWQSKASVAIEILRHFW